MRLVRQPCTAQWFGGIWLLSASINRRQGAADNKQAMMDKAMKRMNDWNKSNPDTLIQINAQQIRGRVRQMLTDKDSRLMKSAPREMRGRMGLDLAESK